MLEKQLYENYQIYMEDLMYIGNDYIVFANGERYLLRGVSQQGETRLPEQIRMTEHLLFKQEKDIAIPIKSKTGHYLTSIDGEEMVVYQLPHQYQTIAKEGQHQSRSIGKRLASFHLLGEDFPLNYPPWNGTWYVWKARWIKRLDQLENWYVKKLEDPYKTEIDTLVLNTLPYFLGITENAIQMMQELKMSELNSAMGEHRGNGNTICHSRFHEACWLTIDEQSVAMVKVPTAFFYDHFTRDIAEYIRQITHGEQPFAHKKMRVERFLYRYSTVRSLEEYDIKLIIARCLFPAQYFDQIEEIYQTVDPTIREQKEEAFLLLLSMSEEHEKLVSHIAKLFLKKSNSAFLPEWLARKKTAY